MRSARICFALMALAAASSLLALLICPACGQEKGTKATEETPSRQIAPPGGYNPKEDKRPWRDSVPRDQVLATDSTANLFADRQPFPPKGFAKGVVVTLGDDSGEPGTYRLAFRWQANGQDFPLIECRQLQAFEDRLLTLGRDARHGKQVVEVKGTVSQYRGMNFLLLSDFHVPTGPYGAGGVPAAQQFPQTVPEKK